MSTFLNTFVPYNDSGLRTQVSQLQIRVVIGKESLVCSSVEFITGKWYCEAWSISKRLAAFCWSIFLPTSTRWLTEFSFKLSPTQSLYLVPINFSCCVSTTGIEYLFSGAYCQQKIKGTTQLAPIILRTLRPGRKYTMFFVSCKLCQFYLNTCVPSQENCEINRWAGVTVQLETK